LLRKRRKQFWIVGVFELPARQCQQFEAVGQLFVAPENRVDLLGRETPERDAGDRSHVAQIDQQRADSTAGNVVQIIDQEQPQPDILDRAVRFMAKLRNRLTPHRLAAKGPQDVAQERRDPRPRRRLDQGDRDRRVLISRVFRHAPAREEAARDSRLAVIACADHKKIVRTHAALGLKHALQPLMGFPGAAVTDPQVPIDAGDAVRVVQQKQPPAGGIQMCYIVRVRHSETLDIGKRNDGAFSPGRNRGRSKRADLRRFVYFGGRNFCPRGL
jgi:hypothetical protein